MNGGAIPPWADRLRGLRVLVVDDDAVTRRAVEMFLQPSENTIEIAINGAMAVSKFQAAKFDLVLMDLEMPEMDGHAAIRVLRDWERSHATTPIPMIALTASSRAIEEKEKCLRSGFTAFLTKPVGKEQLWLAIAETMDLAPAFAHPQPMGTGTRAQVGSELSSLLPSFVKEMRQIVDSMDEALGRMDFASVRASAHKLAGAGGSCGFGAISTWGRLVESAAEVSNHFDLVTLIEELDSYLSDLEVRYV